MSPSATSTRVLNPSRDGDSPTALGQPVPVPDQELAGPSKDQRRGTVRFSAGELPKQGEASTFCWYFHESQTKED